MWCGRENSSAVHGGNRCESTGVCRRGFVSRILTHTRRGVGLNEVFRKTKRKTEGPQHFAFPEISRENRGVFGAPFCFSRVSLGKLASFPESESWSGAKSDAKLRKSARYPGGRRVFSRYTRGFSGMPAKHRSILTVRLILGPNQPQTRLRARKNGWFPRGVSPGN